MAIFFNFNPFEIFKAQPISKLDYHFIRHGLKYKELK
jgi:hypothetical protein